MVDTTTKTPQPDATELAWGLALAIMTVVNDVDRHSEALMDVFMRYIHEHLFAHRIMVVQKFDKAWKVTAHSGVKFSFTGNLDQSAVPRNGEVISNVPAGAFSKGFVSTPEEGVGWDCWVAIVNGDQQERLLVVDDVTSARDFESYRLSLQLMANVLGESLRLREIAMQDELTDLPNREAFKIMLEKQARVVNRDTKPAIVVVAHLHHAKRIRDSKMIMSIMLSLAQHFKAHLPETGGQVGRFGKKSLVIMLENMDLSEAQKWAKKVRAKFPRPCRFELSSSNAFELDFNLGLAILDHSMVAKFVDAKKHEPFKLAADIVIDHAKQALTLAIDRKTPTTAIFTPTGIQDVTDVENDSNSTPD